MLQGGARRLKALEGAYQGAYMAAYGRLRSLSTPLKFRLNIQQLATPQATPTESTP
jgi:hypothetical protein